MSRGRDDISGRALTWVMVGILLLAAFLRLYYLGGEGLDGDEIWVAQDVEFARIGLVFEKHVYDFVLYALTYLSTRLFGSSALAFRLPAVFAGILGVAFIYTVGKRIFDWPTGLVAAFLLAIAPFHVMHSRTARYYPLFLFLTLGVIFFSWKFSRGRLAAIVGIVVCNVLNYYNHNASLLVLLGSFLFLCSIIILDLILERENRQAIVRRILVLGLGLSLVIVLLLPSRTFGPTFTSLLQSAIPGLHLSIPSWTVFTASQGQVGAATRSTYDIVAEALESYSGAATRWGMGLFIAVAAAGLIRGLKSKPRAALLLLFIFGTPLLVLAAKLLGRYVAPRYFMGLYAVYLLAAAYGITWPFCWQGWRAKALPLRVLGPSLSLALFLILTLSSVWYARGQAPLPRRVDWQSVGAYLGAGVEADDLVIVTPNLHHSREHLLYYWNTTSQDAAVVFMKDSDITHPMNILGRSGPRDVWWVLWTGGQNLVTAQVQGFDVQEFNQVTVLHRDMPLQDPIELAEDGQFVLDLLVSRLSSIEGPGYLDSVLGILERNLAICELAVGDPASAFQALDSGASHLLSAMSAVGDLGGWHYRQLSLFYELYDQIGGVELAQKWYERLSASFPGATSYLRGQAYLGDGAISLATASFQEAIDLQPTVSLYHVGLARAYQDGGDLDLAEAELRRALALEAREHWIAYPRLIDLCLSQGRLAEVLELYDDAISRSTYVPEPYVGLGDLLYRFGRYSEAADQYQAALDLYRDSGSRFQYVLPKLAHALISAGEIEQGILVMRGNVEENPTSSTRWIGLAEVYEQVGNPSLASQMYRRAIEINPKEAQSYDRLAENLMGDRQFDDALAVYGQAAAAFPHSAWPYLRLGDLYARLNRPDLASSAYRRAVAIEPRDTDARERLSSASLALARMLPHVQVSAGVHEAVWQDGQWIVFDSAPRVLVAATDLKVQGKHHPDSVLFHPPVDGEGDTRIAFSVPQGIYSSLVTSFGLADEAASGSNGVRYRLLASPDGGRKFDLLLDTHVTDNTWQSRTVDLSAFLEDDLLFWLEANAAGDIEYDWLVITLEMQPVLESWNLSDGLSTASARSGGQRLIWNGEGFESPDGTVLVNRSLESASGWTPNNQVQIHPVAGDHPTELQFDLVIREGWQMAARYAMAGRAVMQSDGARLVVDYRLEGEENRRHRILDAVVDENVWQSTFHDLTKYAGERLSFYITAHPLASSDYDWLQLSLSFRGPGERP